MALAGSDNLLDFAMLVTLAERDSGAFGLADDGLLARVRTLVEWINERGPYTRDEHRAILHQIRGTLANRMRMLVDRQRYPAIAEERIERPIFIVGFPRAGTTLIHSLLAEDPEALAPQSWHLYSPSPPPGAMPVAAERIAYAQRMVETWMDFCPAQKPMHPYIDKGAFQLCEDEEVLALDFRNTYCYHYYRVPTMTHHVVLDPDPMAAFGFHREFLQAMQWNTGKTRWVCKGPGHQGVLDGLFATYPDAVCVWPHRPMGEMFDSFIALSAAIYDAVTGQPKEIREFSRMLAEQMRDGFERMLASDLIDDPRIMHLPFRDITADPVGVIRRIYERVDRDVTPEFALRIQAWLDAPENAVDRYGRYPYSYDSLGLDRGWVEQLFAGYSQRFGLD